MSTSDRGRRALAALLLGAGATLASLCLHAGCIPTDPCLRNSDCTHGERCLEGTCAVPPPEQPATSDDAALDTALDAASDAAADTDLTETDETATDGALDETIDADDSG